MPRISVRLFALFFVLISGQAFAVDYYWRSSPFPEHRATPLEVCSSVPAGYNGYNWSNFYVVRVTDITFKCFARRTNLSGTASWEGIEIATNGPTRYGDNCPVDTIYNSATGACDAPPPPPPECKVGDLFPAKGSVAPVVTSADGRNFVNSRPSGVCYQQCTYEAPSDVRPASCYGTAGGEGWCNYILKGTGVNCSTEHYTFAESGPSLNPPDTPNVPDSDPDDPQCPAGWSVSNGTCFKNPPKPCDPSTGEVCPPGDGDGDDGSGGDNGGGDDGGDNGGGDDPAGDPSSGAEDDLDDLEEQRPDTEGEPCKPRADGTGCDGPTARGEACEDVLECTGDAIQCAMLRKQKRMVCDAEYTKEAQQFVENQIAKEDYDLTTHEVDGGALFSAGLNAPRWLPAACPAPKSIAVKGVSTSLSFEPACDFAMALGPLFVALAGVFFAVYVGRAFGGS